MPKWEPEDYDDDPMINALLNMAAGLHRQADATQDLLYALKYSRDEGMSVAEAIEVAGRAVAGSLSDLGGTLDESLEKVSTSIDDVAVGTAGSKG